MSTALRAVHPRPVFVPLFAATLLCAAVAAPCAVASLDEPVAQIAALAGAPDMGGNGWPVSP